MTTDLPVLSTPSDLETLVRVAQEAASVAVEPIHESIPGLFLVARPVTMVHAELDVEPSLPAPRRKHGTETFGRVDGFCEFIDRHRNGDLELWASKPNASLRAVLNPSSETSPGWGDHQAIFGATTTVDLKAWMAVHRKEVGQQAFADHLEDMAHTLIRPSPAEMLTVAQSIEATVTAEVRAAHRLVDGARTSVVIETVVAKAGTSAAVNVEIPALFEIGLALFEGTAPIRLQVRLRYRIGGGHVTFTPIIDRLDDALTTAFGELVAEAETELGVNAWWR